MAFNPETFHGTHYTPEQFDATVQQAVAEWIADNEEEDLPLNERRNIEFNIARDIHSAWNPDADENTRMQFQTKLTEKIHGFVSQGYQKENSADPLQEPIHGISLRDYSAANAKIAAGVSVDQVCKALGVEQPLWEEASAIWVTRMQQDSTFNIATLMGQYFGEANQHPKLGSLGTSAGGVNPNLQRLQEDVYFYHELSGARNAAYAYGLDGAQWIQDNYGINLGDFQGVAMKWMEQRNLNWNSERIMELTDYESAQQEIYAAKFAEEQGGDAADDINF
jgi:hypothetical protein